MNLIISFFVTLFLLIVPISSTPQIFTEQEVKLCSIKFGKKKLIFPDKLWTVNSYDFTLHFSLCKTVQNACNNRTSSCVIPKNNNRILDLGNEFNATTDSTGLESIGGSPCPSNPSKVLKLYIVLQCAPTMKLRPRLLAPEEDDMCQFEVILMHPTCRPACTDLVHNLHLLDARNFPRDIRVETEGRRFSFSVCGPSKDCPAGVSACELTNGTVTPLAAIDTQDLRYNVGKNELTARGRLTDGRKRRFEVLIKCNWTTEASNAKYKIVSTQGKNYKFEIESSFGCVKIPSFPSCTVSSFDNHNYDLRKLDRPEGWNIEGVPDGRITMNMCGSLNHKQDLCLEQLSQICQVKDNKYLNRGSMMSMLTIRGDNVITTFTSGSKCEENSTLSYSTRIDFQCSKYEKGPVFKNYENCVMAVVWETPEACPIDLYKTDNCYVNDRISNRNLAKLYEKTDKIYYLSPDKTNRLVYNLCGPLHESCNNHTDVSFCLKTPNEQVILGWETKEAKSENGLLRMDFRGDSCPNKRTEAKINVQFLCSYKENSTDITVIEDKCKYDVTLYTEYACAIPAKFLDCTYTTGNLTYDLTSLTQTQKNYGISGSDADYVLNVCGPVVTGPGALCHGEAMICKMNKTEPNIKYRYTSLGGVGKPRLLDGALVLEGTMGGLCEGWNHYKTFIKFECSPERMAPVFVSKENCVYNFLWRTPEACPQNNSCVIEGSKTDLRINLSSLKRKSQIFNIDEKTKYKFQLCRNYYLKTLNGIETSSTLKRSFFIHDNKPTIVLDLGGRCTTANDITKVSITLECSEEGIELLNKPRFESCFVNVTLRTPLGCVPKHEQIIIATTKKQVQEVTTTIKETSVSEKNIQKRIITESLNCTLRNAYTGFEWNMTEIKPEQIINNKTIFFVNLQGKSTTCNGVFCRKDKIIPYICPSVVFNYSTNEVLLNYHTSERCNTTSNYELQVRLKCNQTATGGRILTDDLCQSVVSYDMPQSCLLLQQEIIHTSHTGLITGVTISILVALLGLLIYFNRRKVTNYMTFHSDKSRVPIYRRDCSD